MTESTSIYKGDTAGPWNVGHKLDDGTLATLTGSYTCTIKVAGTAIERAVTDLTADSKRFIAALTPTETATLTPGQYVVAIEVVNATTTPPLRVETHIILTVAEQIVGSDHVPTTPDPVTDLRAELAAVRAARIDLMTGKAVQKIRTGRYATEMWYASATLADYDKMIATLEREIAAAEAVAAGRPKRRAISLAWSN